MMNNFELHVKGFDIDELIYSIFLILLYKSCSDSYKNKKEKTASIHFEDAYLHLFCFLPGSDKCLWF